MQTKTLKIFCDLVETKSFSKTAQINNLSQPAITQQIKSLETELNVNLIDKQSKCFKLTKQGEIVLSYARTILSEYYSLIGNIKNGNSIHETHLSIGTSHFVGFYIFSKYLKLILQQLTNTNINLQYLNDYSQIEHLANINLIISEKKYLHPDFASGVLAYDELVLISTTNTSDESDNLNSKSIKSLQNSKLVGFSKEHEIRKYIDNETQKYSVFLKYYKEFDNLELIKQVVLANDLLAIVPISSILHDEKYLFNIFKFSDISLKLPIYYAYNPIKLSKQSTLLQKLFNRKPTIQNISFIEKKPKRSTKKVKNLL